MNASGNMKRPVTVDRLLGRGPHKQMTEEEKRTELELIKDKFHKLRAQKEKQKQENG